MFLQNVGYATFSTSGPFTTVSTNNLPTAIRVFDFAYAVTGAAASSARLWNLNAAGNTTGTLPVVTLNNSVPYIHTDVGYRFPTGIYVWVSAVTVSVNYIEEFL